MLSHDPPAAIAVPLPAQPHRARAEERKAVMDELKPCPFCGSVNVTTWHYTDSGMWTVWCSNCKTEGPFDLSESGAAERWNTRPTEAAAVAAERQRVLGLVDKMVIERFEASWNDDAWWWTEIVHALRAAIESGDKPKDTKE